nr:DEAD/DEAH box helicase family protein [Clostridia bacterium]
SLFNIQRRCGYPAAAFDFLLNNCYNYAMFEGISFNGQFRTYQQKILDGADEYLKDGKIHVVAAPGSGKTILGLELIRRLAEPCIILSPTTTIRNQWGDRFVQNFLNGEDGGHLISYDLRRLKPITSVTYQALHAALKGIINDEDGEDYSSFALLEEVKKYKIKTICLDEAHHLQNEWQKALEAFLSELSGEVKIIALTATPPYDAKPAEWKRYTDVCGEIDEEIFVPELVKQNSLCPHQDFIYFNYPDDGEAASFKAYRERAAKALEELFASATLRTAYARLEQFKTDYDYLYTNAENIIYLCTLFERAGIDVDRKIVKKLTCGKPLPKATPDNLSQAVNFLIKGELLEEGERAACAEIFKRNGVCERGEVSIDLNEKLKRELISSVGKLKSISDIVKSESANKGESLRMLVLTDYIKKDNLSLIGSDQKPDAVSIVSVFETVRKTGVKAAALSGSLVILPDACAQTLKNGNAEFKTTPIGDTGYSEFDFRLGNREKVRLVTKLFEENSFSVLVGTKALLGEGWDAPCVNSLILASFVGSFMLSNQMRGRAIRTDKNQPDKTANVWHLVTVERPSLYKDGTLAKFIAQCNEDKDKINSCDYETVTRRFDCFVAPNYDTGEIENGISRISVIKPPYDSAGIERINRQTLQLSAQNDLKQVWQNAVKNSARLNEVSSVPKKGNAVPPFLFVNLLTAAFLFSIFAACLCVFIECVTKQLFCVG